MPTYTLASINRNPVGNPASGAILVAFTRDDGLLVNAPLVYIEGAHDRVITDPGVPAVLDGEGNVVTPAVAPTFDPAFPDDATCEQMARDAMAAFDAPIVLPPVNEVLP